MHKNKELLECELDAEVLELLRLIADNEKCSLDDMISFFLTQGVLHRSWLDE